MFDPWLIPPLETFRNSIESGRVPSSVILAGAPDLGGAFLALEFAKLYLCADRKPKESCGTCKSCHLFDDLESGSHPDFISLLSSTQDESDRQEDLTHSFSKLLNDMGTPLNDEFIESENTSKGTKSVRIDGIRSLNEWIAQGSVLGKGKVAVISNAHLMGEGAANALLKTFEEPTANTLIILLTKSLELLPATILSRAFKIQIPRVSVETGLDYLKSRLGNEFSVDRAKIALALSFNSPRGAIKYYREELDIRAVELIQALTEDVSSSASTKTVSLLMELSNEHRHLILQEFILELLKCKARIDKDSLPLLKGISLDKLVKIPASHLLDAYNEMKYIKADSPMLNSRAPVSLISAWINSLRKI